MGRPVRVDVIGFLPTIYTTSCKSYCNPAGVSGVKGASLQMEEYPEEIRQHQTRAEELYQRMMSDFPNRVLVNTVNPTSPRGLWLTLKHRPRSRLWLLINGKHVLDASVDYSRVHEAINAEMENVGGVVQ